MLKKCKYDVICDWLWMCEREMVPWVAIKKDNTRWFKYDRDYLCVNKSQFVPVIFEPPCIFWKPIPVAQRSEARGLRPLACWDYGFESRRGHWSLRRVLSGRGLCDGLSPRAEDSYWMWCVVCDLESSRMRRPWPALGCCTRGGKIYSEMWCHIVYWKLIKVLKNGGAFVYNIL